ncbi:MAG: alanine--tRNA ligase [Clostridia bacterium]|nr:alanine--tRNA ligase [Clostridia bacterium]
MEWMGLNEIREKYLSFFESKGHLRAGSFSLVPQGDKSLLLINAGMAPLKKYFTGELTPPRKRMTTCQKCIRTPDIESVGITARHGTYFEMLGNFSFGDYFKHEATAWAWEFCTKVMKMPVEKLWVTIYEDDDEAFDIWTKEVGVAPERIVRLGKEDNFWEHGAGPCGPCSEIYFDRGEKYGCGSPTCGPGCDCDRYTEFWNLVFTQFENDGNGNYSRLKSCNIDTGMGLERLACIMQGVDNIFEVDTVRNIMKHVIDISGVKYHDNEKSDISLRVITDHIRSTTFMIGDGVMPSNEGRGYVLRRLLRRAARHGKLLGVNRPFLYEVCETVIRENKNAYPNLEEKHDLIVKVIKAEEENFAKTVDTGLSLLNSLIEKGDSKVLSGADAFKLQDTFGFPIVLTKEILAEKGLSVDEEAFKKLVEENRIRTRAARKDAGAEAWKGTGNATKGVSKTEFVGYEKLTCEGKVIAAVVGGEKTEFVNEDSEGALIFDCSPFYGESGGQVGDRGLIKTENAVFEVTATTKTADGVILHHGHIVEGEDIAVGEKATLSVDEEKRKATKRNHTAAHLLQAALRKTLGTHVEQAGQLVDENFVRFDFVHFSAMTPEEIEKVETMVNEEILSAVPVEVSEMPIDEAKKLGAMALFSEKYGDVVRVVKIGDFSIELCGGTHAENTGNLGLFKIVSESSVAAGVRRIEGVTGFNSLRLYNENLKLLSDTASALKVANAKDVLQRASGVMAELKEKDKEIEKLSGIIANAKTNAVLENAKDVGGLKVVTALLDDATVPELRKMCDLVRSKGENYVGVIAAVQKEKGTGNICVCCGKEAVKLGAHAGNIARETAKLAGGSGGGKPDSAMAGAKDISALKGALDAAVSIVEGMLG